MRSQSVHNIVDMFEDEKKNYLRKKKVFEMLFMVVYQYNQALADLLKKLFKNKEMFLTCHS